ncbi:MAG: hypothetical protein R3F05_20520 [Planctomycetota bacterium]
MTTPEGETRWAGPARAAVSDADGLARFEGLPQDGSYRARFTQAEDAKVLASFGLWLEQKSLDGAAFAKPRSDPAWEAVRAPGFEQVDVLGPEVVLRLAQGLPLQVRLVDVRNDVEPSGLIWRVEPSLAKSESGARSTTWIPLSPGERGFVSVVHVERPGEPWPSDVCMLDDVSVSARAQELVAFVPLWPEAEVALEGSLASDAADGRITVQCAIDGQDLFGPRVESRGPGQLSVRGIPHRSGGWLAGSLRVGAERLEFAGSLPARVGAPLVLSLHAPGQAPPDPGASLGTPYGLGVLVEGVGDDAQGADGGLGEITVDVEAIVAGEHDDELPSGFSIEAMEWDDDKPAAALTVQVVAAPGVGFASMQASVDGQTRALDASGRARFEGIRAWHVLVHAADDDGVVGTRSVALRPGDDKEVELHVTRGATLDVTVVDTQGRPVPFAKLRLAAAGDWYDLEGTRQRIDPFVDVHGRRTLHAVPVGPDGAGRVTVWVEAHGRRHGSGSVDVRAGGREKLRIVAAPLQAPR